jgi:hypothetical protein
MFGILALKDCVGRLERIAIRTCNGIGKSTRFRGYGDYETTPCKSRAFVFRGERSYQNITLKWAIIAENVDPQWGKCPNEIS